MQARAVVELLHIRNVRDIFTQFSQHSRWLWVYGLGWSDSTARKIHFLPLLMFVLLLVLHYCYCYCCLIVIVSETNIASVGLVFLLGFMFVLQILTVTV